ncbi:hypothetical protein HMPREF0541_00813 [Lacticaseibacillus rhamnosus ATCC 21052]|uniref:Uncharacterized protein n=1 Tax=Lacticaseibacillus rhamnosus (strain LMS2-1) TaxID=525361 RepID=C2JT41_LACRM|nr:conserved hypothetical protein [Lacticaseibacillus rhamnosus ATCC 8530]EEN81788.1 hypothetical protein HMPREF0539_0075 [Lacticaseibacillus rhamnosus LMS2-1]EHJ33832.1 hypothetical protein HMPREF0541_00813 [Lacticaseibacillus rhamnosus ATCC 21052]
MICGTFLPQFVNFRKIFGCLNFRKWENVMLTLRLQVSICGHEEWVVKTKAWYLVA